MALWNNNKEFIFKAVEEMYTDVASRPGAVFHFPTFWLLVARKPVP